MINQNQKENFSKSGSAQSHMEKGDESFMRKKGVSQVGSKKATQSQNSEEHEGGYDLSSLTSRVEDIVSQLKTRASGLDTNITGYVTKRPLVFIAGAVVAGYVAGRLLMNGKSASTPSKRA